MQWKWTALYYISKEKNKKDLYTKQKEKKTFELSCYMNVEYFRLTTPFLSLYSSIYQTCNVPKRKKTPTL